MGKITCTILVARGVAAGTTTPKDAVFKPGDEVTFEGPEGTFLRFPKKDFPFQGPIPPRPVKLPTPAYKVKSGRARPYHIVCGSYPTPPILGNPAPPKKFAPWDGGFVVPP
jgi:hypothetical protein